jgi:hypothetical protein
MFPIAHLWLLEQIVPQPTPAHYLGCVWPDMLFGSPISHPQSHRRGAELLAFAQARRDQGIAGAAEFQAFVIGVITHGSTPQGFDWYSDEQWGDDPTAGGFAFQQGRPLAAETAAACDLPPALGEWKAHNVVEMACELPLYAAHPALGDAFAVALDDRALCERLAEPLGVFYGQPAPALAMSMRAFVEWWVRPVSPTALAEIYTRQVQAKHGSRAPNIAALAELIVRAGEGIRAVREPYLAECVARIGDLVRMLTVG